MGKLRLLPELEPFINRPFSEKLVQTQGVIARNLRLMGKDCVSTFSGGKDSLLVTWMVTRHYPDIPVIFNNTGVEYPETLQYVKEMTAQLKLNLITTTPPGKTFWDCVDQWGFPQGKRTKNGKPGNRNCCYWLKDKPMDFILDCLGSDGYFTGVTAVENRTRMFNARDKGTCYRVKKGYQKVHPILYWTPEEVREYLAEIGLPLNPVYARGADRVGCSTCTAFIDWEKQLSAVNPKLYRLIKSRKEELEQVES